MTTARKKWTILDTVQVAEAVIANGGKWLTNGEPYPASELHSRLG